MHDWAAVLSASTSDSKAEAYQETVVNAVDSFFLLRKVKKRITTRHGWIKNEGYDRYKEAAVHPGGRKDCHLEARKKENGRSGQEEEARFPRHSEREATF